MSDKSVIYFCQTKGVMSLSDAKKIGRPTNDPKNLRVTIRFNDEQSQKIQDYAKKNNLTTSEVIRKAVADLK